jgi:adenylate cyclase
VSQTRRLAAILAADVAGYSRLMGADEGGTLQRLKEIRAELIDPMIAIHNSKAFAVAQGWYAVSFERGRGAVAEERIRVTAQLGGAETGNHDWAERYDQFDAVRHG